MAKKNSGPVGSYVAQCRVRFEGSVYEPGDTVDMPEGDAAPLVSDGALEAAPAEKAAEQPKK